MSLLDNLLRHCRTRWSILRSCAHAPQSLRVKKDRRGQLCVLSNLLSNACEDIMTFPLQISTIAEQRSVWLNFDAAMNLTTSRCFLIGRFCNRKLWCPHMHCRVILRNTQLPGSSFLYARGLTHAHNHGIYYNFAPQCLTLLFQSNIFKFQQVWLLWRIVPFHLNTRSMHYVLNVCT